MSLQTRRQLLLKLMTQDKELAKDAALALQDIDAKLSVTRMVEMLNVGNKPDRVKAIYALGKIGGEKAIAAILTCWNPVKEEDERAAAARALKETNDPTVTKYIWSIFQSETSQIVKIELLQIIKRWKDRRGLALLIKELSQKNPDYLIELIETIGILGDSRAEQYLVNFLKIKHKGILKATIRALGKLE